MIDRDENVTREQKDRQKASLNEVLRFCSNKTDCRRVQVLAFFNEVFDPAKCNQGCDICLDRDKNRFTAEDVTADAIKAIHMVQAFEKGDRITIKDAVECFRGVNGNSKKGLNQNPHFGCGKHWERADGERLLQAMVMEKAFEEFYVQNAMGFNNSYLKVSELPVRIAYVVQLGRTARLFLNGQEKLNMQFRQASPRKPKAAPPAKKRKSGQPNIETFTQKFRNPIAHKRSYQEIMEEEQEFDASPWGDKDQESNAHDDDPIELSDEEVPFAAEVKKRRTLNPPVRPAVRPPVRPLSRASEVIEIDRTSSTSPVHQCFQALQALQTAVSAAL